MGLVLVLFALVTLVPGTALVAGGTVVLRRRPRSPGGLALVVLGVALGAIGVAALVSLVGQYS
jgi:hypothetical protein